MSSCCGIDLTSGGPSGGPPSGPAGGDLGGTYPNPIVVGFQGVPVDAAAPANGDVYQFNIVSGEWEPTAVAALGITLQDAYDGSAGALPSILVTAANGPVTIQDAVAPIGDVFQVRDGAGFPLLAVNGDVVDVGHHDTIISGTPLPIFEAQDATNSLQWWVGDRTFISAQGSLMALSGTYTLDYPNVSFGGLNLTATIQHNQAGFAFNHGLLFNHGNTYRNELNNNVNYGPLQGFIDQPSVQVNRTTAGTVSMALFRSFLSQPSFGRTSTNGTLALTNGANFQGFGNVGAGAIVTTWTRAQLGPFTAGTGTITNYRAIDIANETQPTTIITGIRSAIASAGGGTRRNLEIIGTALSEFTQSNVLFRDGFGVLLGTGSDVLLNWTGSVFELAPAVGDDLRVAFAAGSHTVTTGAATPAVAQILIEHGKGAFGQTSPVGNQKYIFVANAETITIAGEFTQFLLSQAANDTINAALGLYAGWTINAPTPVIGTGSLTTGAALNVGGNPTGTVNRVGLRIISNPVGGSGINAALWITAGLSRFDGRVDINNGVALGGGAPAVLGTIGGAGPTVAAQAQWLEIDIGGVAHWVAAWT